MGVNFPSSLAPNASQSSYKKPDEKLKAAQDGERARDTIENLFQKYNPITLLKQRLSRPSAAVDPQTTADPATTNPESEIVIPAELSLGNCGQVVNERNV